MKDVYILGIESSCDETSCSIVKNGTVELATSTSSQIDIHENFGGVVPEIASREHVKNITLVIEDCLKKANMKIEDVTVIAITYGPGLIGSLLVGLQAAKTLSYIYNKPLVPVHHIAGHIYANSLVEELKFPLIALVVSGGHSELVYMKSEFSFEVIGETLDDAIVDLGNYKKINPRYGDKNEVLRAINNCDYNTMRDISNFFYKTSGIYSRLCRYMAYLYRFDWMVTPYINSDSIKVEKILTTFDKVLKYLDNSGIKKMLGEISLKVIKNGSYYGYLIPHKERIIIQELPSEYCRSRFSVNGRPAVEFNMRFFDEVFRDTTQKIRMLKLFPDEFRKGYIAYKEGKLPPDFAGDTVGWYLLDTNNVIKFNMNGEDFPAFISVIPAIIDLDAAQELDRKKMAQKLLKIIIQKMPVDKNGDLVFDVDEAQQLHNNAVRMLSKAIGIDVLTTFADVDVADMADNSTTTTVDELEKVERTVYNEAGVSQMQFNTDGNIALEKSILNDEAAMYNLLLQFEEFLNYMIDRFNTTAKINFKVSILTTTIYNYQEMAKLYKEQTQLGYSKMLPQIALGQSQSAILANAYFENDILDLVNVFIPPISSNTMSADALSNRNGDSSSSSSEGGRPTNESQGKEVTEKTIQNKESQS